MAHSAENMPRYSFLDLPGKNILLKSINFVVRSTFKKMIFAAFFGMLSAIEAEAERHL